MPSLRKQRKPEEEIIRMLSERGLRPVAEHRFHDVRKWRFDVALIAPRIAIEVEGGLWVPGGGAHSRPTKILRDIEKYNEAVMLGWRVLRTIPKKQEYVKVVRKAIELAEHDIYN